MLTRKAKFSPDEATHRVRRLLRVTERTPTDETTFVEALGLAAQHRMAIFDAIILAVAVAARADVLISEDMQDGFAWRGLTVTNPFGPAPDPRIADWLR